MTEKPTAHDPPARDERSLAVTLFGEHDAINQAISAELDRRGCRTHAVSVETGWLSSTTNAVLRLDTASGASALAALTESDGPGVHVVATLGSQARPSDSARLQRLCKECAEHHDVSLLRHEPIRSLPVQPDLDLADADPPAQHLALAVVDEVAEQTYASPAPTLHNRSIAV